MMDPNSSAFEQATAVNKCDYCTSAVRVHWMCVNCDKIVCELCKNNHSKKHKILRIQGALEVVIAEDTGDGNNTTLPSIGKAPDVMKRTGGQTRVKTKLKTSGSVFVNKQQNESTINKGKGEKSSKNSGNIFGGNGLNLHVTNSIKGNSQTESNAKSKDNKETPDKDLSLSNEMKHSVVKVDALDLDLTYESKPSHSSDDSDSLLSLKDRKKTIQKPSPSVSPIKVIQNNLQSSTGTGNGSGNSSSKGGNAANKVSFVGRRPLPRKPFEGNRIHKNDAQKFIVKIISSDSTSLHWMNSICVSKDSEAWIGDVNPKILSHVCIEDNKIMEMESFEFKVTDIVVVESGGLLVSYEEGQIIQHLSLDGAILNTINTEPLCPQGLFMTQSGAFWVCLAEKVHAHKFPKCKVKIAKMTINGDTTDDLEFDRAGKKLFSYPHSIIENVNGDLCVVDMQIRERVQLMVFNSSEKLRFIYDGRERTYSGKPCDFGMVRNDSEGQLLLSDYVYHRIHMLTKDGEFIQFLLTENDGIYYPFAIAVDSAGIVWIDCKGSKEKSAYSNIVRVQYQQQD